MQTPVRRNIVRSFLAATCILSSAVAATVPADAKDLHTTPGAPLDITPPLPKAPLDLHPVLHQTVKAPFSLAGFKANANAATWPSEAKSQIAQTQAFYADMKKKLDAEFYACGRTFADCPITFREFIGAVEKVQANKGNPLLQVASVQALVNALELYVNRESPLRTKTDGLSFSALKLYVLEKMGFHDARLVVEDVLINGEPTQNLHSVVVVPVNGANWVLDNVMNGRSLPFDSVSQKLDAVNLCSLIERAETHANFYDDSYYNQGKQLYPVYAIAPGTSSAEIYNIEEVLGKGTEPAAPINSLKGHATLNSLTAENAHLRNKIDATMVASGLFALPTEADRMRIMLHPVAEAGEPAFR